MYVYVEVIMYNLLSILPRITFSGVFEDYGILESYCHMTFSMPCNFLLKVRCANTG